jgi:hypothetical protein
MGGHEIGWLTAVWDCAKIRIVGWLPTDLTIRVGNTKRL